MDYDCIVVGLGGVGSACAYHLAKRGLKIIALEQFHPAHDLGSSHGETRTIRLAYFEHPDYVPLIQQAFNNWTTLSHESGQQLFHSNGVLSIGPQASDTLQQTVFAAKQHNINIESLDTNALRSRYPFLHIEDEHYGILEPDAGYLEVENCVTAHIELAKEYGASCHFDENVLTWEANHNSVTVNTNKASYQAKSMILAAGPWVNEILSQLQLPITILQKTMMWFDTPNFAPSYDYPNTLFETNSGDLFYAFPQLYSQEIKVGNHSGGQVIHSPQFKMAENTLEETTIESFAQHCLKHITPSATRKATCYYSQSVDEHFIVDRHPTYPQVCFAAGLSGHGFKLSTTLGEALADLIINGRTTLPIDFLSLKRFNL